MGNEAHMIHETFKRRHILQALVALGLAAPALGKSATKRRSNLRWRKNTLLTLSSMWRPGGPTRDHELTFALHNRGAAIEGDYRLVVSGPSGFDLKSSVRNGEYVFRQGVDTVLRPQPKALAGAASWDFAVIWPSDRQALSHWTDLVHAAYVVFADGSVATVTVEPCASATAPLEKPRLGVAIDELAATSSTLSIVPWPADVQCKGDRAGLSSLALPGGAVSSAFAEMVALLFPGERLLSSKGLKVRFREDASLPVEGYAIEFAATSATVSASGDQGRLYGLVTLGQMIRGSARDPAQYRFPASGTIRDVPAHAWRGCMLDVSRRFFDTGEIKHLLAVMTWNKLNRFHWHLTDDEGWRPEIAAFPALTEIGAWRGEGLPIPAFCGSGAERYGGSYSRADMAGVVLFASRLGIDVIPEIDMPGHFFAARVALPQLSDPDEKTSDISIQKFSHNVLNPGLDFTYRFAETLIGELTDIFPSRYFHIGGDEVPDRAWVYSPAAQARLKAIGGKTTADLQADFLRKLQTMLKAHGRITGAWEEAAGGGGLERESSYMVAWQRAKSGPPLAAQGYDVVMAPGKPYYLNAALSDSWWEPGASYYGSVSLEESYTFDPLAGFADADVRRVMGVQACIWTPLIDQPGIFERLVFPRLSAVAENGWSAPRQKDFARFRRAARLMPTLYGNT